MIQVEGLDGRTAVVTGAGRGIGQRIAEVLAGNGARVAALDLEAPDHAGVLGIACDVSDEGAVEALAAATLDRFGAVHVLCNNAGVVTTGDPWFGPVSTWQWVLGVNLWGVIHGVRAFLPTLIGQGEGHIVNTASMAGLMPGFQPSYDASKHAVVAITEDLYSMLNAAGLPIGVSVLCPGWVRTNIIDAERNWPAALGEAPPPGLGSEIVERHVRRAIDEGVTPAAVADQVADAVSAGRYWVFPHPEFVEIAAQRWATIAEGQNPGLQVDMPGLPPAEQLAEEMAALLAPPPA